MALSLAIVAAAAIALSLYLAGSDAASPAVLTPAIGDRTVFYSGTGHGSQAVGLATAQGSDGTTVQTIKDGQLSIVGSCIGNGLMEVTLRTGGFTFGISCSASSGSLASDSTQQGDYPWPRTAVVSAPAGSVWSLAVVDPTGSYGVGQN